MSQKKRAVFLDRDGVINQVILRDGITRAPDHLKDFKYFPKVPEAVEMLKTAGFLLVVVTNQPDVARGWQSQAVVESMNQKVLNELGVHDIRVCFHDDKDLCVCRKPKPGMLLAATLQWDIDLSRSFMVGDRLTDVTAGQMAGCRTILVGKHTHPLAVVPDWTAESLWEATQLILSFEGGA